MATDEQAITDEEIARAVQRGQTQQFELLMTRYQAKLFRYARYLVHDEQLAADITQDTFIKSYANLRSFNVSRKFSSWIYRIAHNEAMNAVRRHKHTVSESELDGAQELYVVESGVEQTIDRQILRHDVQICLRELDAKYREVLVLYYYEQMKYDQIGDVLHMPTSTVGVRINRAKAALKKICLQKGVDYE